MDDIDFNYFFHLFLVEYNMSNQDFNYHRNSIEVRKAQIRKYTREDTTYPVVYEIYREKIKPETVIEDKKRREKRSCVIL